MFLVQVIALDSDDFEVKSKHYRCNSRTTAEKLQSKIIDKYARLYLSEDWDAEDEELAKISDEEVEEWKEYNVSIDEDGNAQLYGADSGHGEVNIIELNDAITSKTLDTVEIETPYYY